MYTWSVSNRLNEQNYNLGIETINWLMDMYKSSLENPVQILDENKDLDLKHVQLFETLSTFTDSYEQQAMRPRVKQTVIAVGGISIKNPKMGVIAFRGTSNNQEWVEDIKSIKLVPVKTIGSSSQAFSSVEKLKGVDTDVFPESLKIGDGFYNVYSTRTGCRNNRNGCVCISDCISGTCYYSENGNYSMLGQECSGGEIGLCKGQSQQSLNGQVYDYVNDMITNHGVKNFIITGHSLGGALVNLCVFHLLYAFGPNIIHSVYSFASPRTGNDEFALSLFPLYNRYFTVINSNDLVPSLPLPFPGCFSHSGMIKIFTQLVTDDCNTAYLGQMHSLKIYRQNFSYLTRI